jgi:hypothetical protein
VSGDGAVRTIAFDGRASEIFSSDDSISDLAWSPDGAYVLVSTYGPPQRLTLVERSTGRSVSLPLPPVADAHLVAVAGGGALPAEPLPATEPAAAPTPAPAGGDVAGMPGLLASWLATENGHLIAHAERLVPTERGGVRVAAGMPPIDLGDAPGPGDRATFIRLVPRPGSSDILVWITTDDTTRGMLWDGSSAVRPLTMPPDWPVNAYDVAWSPDGRRLAGSGPDPSAPEGSPGVLAVAAPGGAHATIVPYVGDYDRLEGWWSTTELRVGHVICTEGCPGRYSFSARLRVSDHRLTPLTPADRGHAPVDYVYQDDEHHRIVMTMINEAPETDLRIAWPETLGWHDDIEARVTGDGRSLLVTRTVGVTTEAYRIDDVVGRARNGTLADPKPTKLGTIAGRHLTIEFAPGEAWALVYDRVGGVTLVRIADGRTWPLDRDRDRVWVSPG